MRLLLVGAVKMKAILLLSSIHFVVFMALFLVGLDFSVIDGGEPSPIVLIAKSSANFLGQPAFYLAKYIPSPAPDAVEWFLLICNSLIWGLIMRSIGYLFGRSK